MLVRWTQALQAPPTPMQKAQMALVSISPEGSVGNRLWLHLSRQLAAFVRVTGLYGDKGVWQNDSGILGYGQGHLALRLDLARAPVALGSSVKRESEPLNWDGVQLSAKAS